MATINITGDQFSSTIEDNAIVLVDFWASWCGPCRQFAPVYEAASADNPDITFAKVDTDAEQVLAASASITSIPTLMAFRDGVLLFNKAGALPKSALNDLIAQVRNLDMDQVRADLQAAGASDD